MAELINKYGHHLNKKILENDGIVVPGLEFVKKEKRVSYLKQEPDFRIRAKRTKDFIEFIKNNEGNTNG